MALAAAAAAACTALCLLHSPTDAAAMVAGESVLGASGTAVTTLPAAAATVAVAAARAHTATVLTAAAAAVTVDVSLVLDMVKRGERIPGREGETERVTSRSDLKTS